MKAPTARLTSARWRRARPATLVTAWVTMASTAGASPANSAPLSSQPA